MFIEKLLQNYQKILIDYISLFMKKWLDIKVFQSKLNIKLWRQSNMDFDNVLKMDLLMCFFSLIKSKKQAILFKIE